MSIENQPKNHIPDDILEDADGDPRSAFGVMAELELGSNQSAIEAPFFVGGTYDHEPARPLTEKEWKEMEDAGIVAKEVPMPESLLDIPKTVMNPNIGYQVPISIGPFAELVDASLDVYFPNERQSQNNFGVE